MKIEFDRNFEKNLRAAIEPAIDEHARGLQRLMDNLVRQYAGQPVEVIKPELRRRWRASGGEITDPDLTEYAQHISNGTRFVFKR